ncbi:MAG: lipopolysaccharide heptosyltransferase II [Planctomycetota bacterium]
MEDGRAVYVRMPNWVGDVVMATPALAALRARFPDSKILVAAKPFQHGLLNGLPSIDALWPVEGRGLRGSRMRAHELRGAGCGTAVLLPNSLRTALAPWLAGVPVRVGTALNGRGLLLTHRVHPPREGRRRRPEPMPIYYLRLSEQVGAGGDPEAVHLVVTDEDEAKAQAHFDAWGLTANDAVVGLNPGASFGASKLWLPEHWAALADRLSDEGLRVVLLVGPGEEAIADEIASRAKKPVINTSKDIVRLDALKAVCRRLSLLVTNDTGPRHIASAVGTAAVVLMGPTDARYTAYGLSSVSVLQSGATCAPCHLKRCPLDHRCMRDIHWERVASVARSRISSLAAGV